MKNIVRGPVTSVVGAVILLFALVAWWQDRATLDEVWPLVALGVGLLFTRDPGTPKLPGKVAVAAVVATAVLGQACSRKVVTLNHQDSLVVVERVSVDTLRVAGDSVQVWVTGAVLDSLRVVHSEQAAIRPEVRTPVATKRKGGATVTAYLARDGLGVEASCDSLERVVLALERQVKQTRRETVAVPCPKCPESTPWWVYAGYLATGVVVGFILKQSLS